MQAWTYTPNYPVLLVSLAAAPPGPFASIVPASPGGLAAASTSPPPPPHPNAPPAAPEPPVKAQTGDNLDQGAGEGEGEGADASPPPGLPPPGLPGLPPPPAAAPPPGGYVNVRQASVTGTACNRSDPGSPRWWVPMSFRLPVSGRRGVGGSRSCKRLVCNMEPGGEGIYARGQRSRS